MKHWDLRLCEGTVQSKIGTITIYPERVSQAVPTDQGDRKVLRRSKECDTVFFEGKDSSDPFLNSMSSALMFPRPLFLFPFAFVFVRCSLI